MHWPFSRSKPAPLLNPSDPESEPDASSVQQVSKSAGEDDQALIELVTQRFELAMQARQDLEPEWAMCIAAERGYSHLKYNAATRTLEDGRNPDDLDFWRPTNLIRGFGSMAVARFTMMEPGALIQPLTKRDLDQRAAQELRVAEEHYNAKLDSRAQLQRLSRLSWTVGDSFLLQYWDPTALASVPVKWDKTGEIVGYEERPVGDLVEVIVPGWDVYADPRAARWEDCQWVIHAVEMPLAEVERRYGRFLRQACWVRPTYGAHSKRSSLHPGQLTARPPRIPRTPRCSLCTRKPPLAFAKGARLWSVATMSSTKASYPVA